MWSLENMSSDWQMNWIMKTITACNVGKGFWRYIAVQHWCILRFNHWRPKCQSLEDKEGRMLKFSCYLPSWKDFIGLFMRAGRDFHFIKSVCDNAYSWRNSLRWTYDPKWFTYVTLSSNETCLGDLYIFYYICQHAANIKQIWESEHSIFLLHLIKTWPESTPEVIMFGNILL